MNPIIPLPAMLREARRPRGETHTPEREMGVRNRHLWRKRQREHAELHRLNPKPLPDCRKVREDTGAVRDAILAAMADGQPWRPAHLASATGHNMPRIYGALNRLLELGSVRKQTGKRAVGMRVTEWVKC